MRVSRSNIADSTYLYVNDADRFHHNPYRERSSCTCTTYLCISTSCSFIPTCCAFLCTDRSKIQANYPLLCAGDSEVKARYPHLYPGGSGLSVRYPHLLACCGSNNYPRYSLLLVVYSTPCPYSSVVTNKLYFTITLYQHTV